MISILLQTTDIVQDVNFNKAIGLEGSFARVSTNKFPIEETLKAIKSSNIKNIICFSDVINDYTLIQRIILESRAFKKNLFIIFSKNDFDESDLNKKEWLFYNGDEFNEIAQSNDEVFLKNRVNEYNYKNTLVLSTR